MGLGANLNSNMVLLIWNNKADFMNVQFIFKFQYGSTNIVERYYLLISFYKI